MSTICAVNAGDSLEFPVAQPVTSTAAIIALLTFGDYAELEVVASVCIKTMLMTHLKITNTNGVLARSWCSESMH
jgi:hypothetical protein